MVLPRGTLQRHQERKEMACHSCARLRGTAEEQIAYQAGERGDAKAKEIARQMKEKRPSVGGSKKHKPPAQTGRQTRATTVKRIIHSR
jgi:hypothetical protein